MAARRRAGSTAPPRTAPHRPGLGLGPGVRPPSLRRQLFPKSVDLQLESHVLGFVPVSPRPENEKKRDCLEAALAKFGIPLVSRFSLMYYACLLY